jgi:hypothetical protein
LAYARFHALIGRILPGALKRDFHATGLVTYRRLNACWDKTLLSQFSGLHFERENQISGLPLERL